MKKQKVCIVGDGLTGLLSAVALGELDLNIEIFGNFTKLRNLTEFQKVFIVFIVTFIFALVAYHVLYLFFGMGANSLASGSMLHIPFVRHMCIIFITKYIRHWFFEESSLQIIFKFYLY